MTPPQLPDGKPGRYYVTARDPARGRVAFLLGPFTQHRPGLTAHRQALGAVTLARRAAVQTFSDRSTAFAVFGTSRLPLDAPGEPPRGLLNSDLTPWKETP